MRRAVVLVLFVLACSKAERAEHVNLDLITMRPVAQSANHLLARGPLRPRPVA